MEADLERRSTLTPKLRPMLTPGWNVRAFHGDHAPEGALRTNLFLNAAAAVVFDTYGPCPHPHEVEIAASEPLSIPITGGRLLLLEESSSQQACVDPGPHTDFSVETWFWFLAATGPDSSPVVVCPFAHTVLALAASTKTGKEMQDSAAALASKVVIIPPLSVFMARGDLIHAGTGGDDRSPPAGGKDKHVIPRCIRYYGYGKEADGELLDAVYLRVSKGRDLSFAQPKNSA